MIVLIAASTFVLGLSMNWFDAFFSSLTASTTVGFSSVGKAGIIGGPAWGSLQKSILIVLMVVGGGFGSTAGAIKLIRTVVLIMSLYWLIKSALLPDSAVVPFQIEDRTFPKEAILQTAIFSFAYIVLLVVGSLITMAAMPAESAVNCVFDSASAQGTVGLTTGVTSPTMPAAVKITYIIQMWIGRLEVIPVVVLLGYVIGKIPPRREPF